MHILLHIPEFARRFGSVGAFTEQGFESLHADVNSHIAKRRDLRTAEAITRASIQHNHVRNIYAQVLVPRRCLLTGVRDGKVTQGDIIKTNVRERVMSEPHKAKCHGILVFLHGVCRGTTNINMSLLVYPALRPRVQFLVDCL